MSSSNVMRLWKDAIVVGGENIDVSMSTTALAIALPTGSTITGLGNTTLGNLTLKAATLSTDVTTGLKIGGNASQKLGFYGTTPAVQPGNSGVVAGTSAGNLANISTATGNIGSSAYTLGDIVAALKTSGLIAQ